MSKALENYYNAYKELLDALKDEIKSKGGFVRLVDNEDESRYEPYGITSEWVTTRRNAYDIHTDCYILAVKIDENDDVWFFADPVCMNTKIIYTDEDLKSEDYKDYWFCLDYDCCNPCMHNIERIAHWFWPDV